MDPSAPAVPAAGQITGMKQRCRADLLADWHMGDRAPHCDPSDADILAVFRIAPRDGVDPDEAAGAERAALDTRKLVTFNYAVTDSVGFVTAATASS